MDKLEVELKTYEEKKVELLANSRGKFVLIKGTGVIGVYETENDAVNEGYQRFNNSPFLVKPILDIEPTFNFLSQLITV